MLRHWATILSVLFGLLGVGCIVAWEGEFVRDDFVVRAVGVMALLMTGFFWVVSLMLRDRRRRRLAAPGGFPVVAPRKPDGL